jgi:hypothetical protein
MPLTSAFTPCGQLECSSKPSVAETVYRAIVANLGGQYDLTVGGHNEATVYARARSIARAMQAQRRAGNQAYPLKCQELLPLQEAGYGLVPGETDDMIARQQALAARMLLPRGATSENVEAQLRAIVGASFVAYRTPASSEIAKWPATPANGPGVFPKAGSAAMPKYIRLTDPVAQTGAIVVDSYSETNKDTDGSLVNGSGGTYSAFGQSFTGVDTPLYSATFYLKRVNAGTGLAVAKIYAHSGTFGVNGVPAGTPLATSSPIDVATLSNSAYALVNFTFPGVPLLLSSALRYFAVIEYSAGGGANSLAVGLDVSAPTAHGSVAHFTGGAWVSDGQTYATCFYVNTTLRVGYAPIEPTQVQTPLAAGDVMTVQLENLGLAEKVTIVSVGVDAIGAFFRTVFANAHDIGASGIVGSVPVWTSTQRSALIVVTSIAALSADKVRRINDLMGRIARGVSVWSVAQPTTPGATTMGPFTLGASPLGAVTLASVTI